MRSAKYTTVRLVRLLVAGGLCLLIIAAVAGLYVPKTVALSNIAPDSNDFGRTSVDFTLSNTHDVANSSSMALTVYHSGLAKPGNLTISVSYQGGAKTSSNQNSQGYGQVQFNGGGATNPTSFVIPISSWRLDSSGQGYEATFSAALANGSRSGDDSNHVNFALSTASGYIIGPNGGSQFAVVQPNGYCWDGHNCAKYYGYQLPFAPDCSVSKSGTAEATIYDMDDRNSVIQPRHLKVQVKDITTNTVVNNDKWSGSEGNGGTARFTFTYSPGNKYKLLLLDVNANNVLQITLPFDSVNYALNCSSSSSSGGAPTCPYLSVSPSGDIPINKSFSVTAAGDYADATTAKAVYKNGGRAYYVMQNNSGTTVSSASGGTVSGTTITGSWTVPGQQGGVYTLTGGVKGGSGDESCSEQITVANHPYFSVVGGDIAAGAGFEAGTNTCKLDSKAGIVSWNNDHSKDYPNYNGAGSQLAALALSNIESFVSGQGSAYAPYALSFANSPTPGSPYYGGKFGSLPCLPDYANMVTSTTVWPGSYATSGSYVYPSATGTGNLTLGGTPPGGIPHDTVINLKVNGDVYITGNITYDDSKGPGHYPRFNLIATGSIYIAPNVTELHGLYVAEGATGSGIFATCASGPGAELDDFDTCGHSALTVYGTVAAKTLHLDRSVGDARLNNGAAERFVYSPELWLATPECRVIPTDPDCSVGSGTGGWDAVSTLPPTL